MSLPLPRKTPPKKMPRNRLHVNRRRATSAGSLGRIRAALYSLINFLLLDFRLGPPSLAASRQNTRNTHDRLVFTGERRGRGRHLLVVHGVYWIDIIRVLLLRIFQRAAGAFIQGLRGQNKAATPSRYARATRRSLRAHPGPEARHPGMPDTLRETIVIHVSSERKILIPQWDHHQAQELHPFKGTVSRRHG